jgi:hypothetical protein
MEKNKSYRVAGGILRNGVLLRDPRNDMARSAGAPKRLATPTAVVGQASRTRPSHAYLHGQAVDDEVCDKRSTGKQVPVHPGMASRTNGDGPELLRQASDMHNLGKMGDVTPGQLPSPAAKRNAG